MKYKKNEKCFWRIAGLVIFGISAAAVASGKNDKSRTKNADLEFPDNGASMESIDSNIQSIARYQNRIFMGLLHKAFVIEAPFNGKKAFQDQTFGILSASKRLSITQDLSRANMQGLAVIGDRLLIFDGENLQVAVMRLDNSELTSNRSIAWDVIRPAKDRGGEPTRMELESARKKFTKAFHAATADRFTGLAWDREGWLGKDGFHYFFIASRLKGFPLVTMRCSKEDLGLCHIDRACDVEGLKVGPEGIAGIAVDVKTRQLLLLDEVGYKIHHLKFKSCFSVTKVGERGISKKIKHPNSLYIDDDRMLWMTSDRSDDYHNATAYFWEQW